MRFVALDLETTGLSPETDTIIEVAAVAFDIERDSEGHYEATNIVEHSQLVYPGRMMTEEISMITGITDEMLDGKSLWSDIREKVQEFIGTDTIIVGHNVLFDVAMLRTHDIDLTDYAILDTFELSEILSQDVESLNLGYLAGTYGLSAGDKEHRALGDTRLSVGLFVHYLNKSVGLPDDKKAIFTLAGQHEEKANLGLFAEILGWKKNNTNPFIISKDEESTPIKGHTQIDIKEFKNQASHNYTLTSLPLGRTSEGEFLREHIKKGSKTHIGVFGHAQTTYMHELVQELGYTGAIYRAPEEYCSIDELRERIERNNWKRKESILITKLLYWLEDTDTGLLGELKLYGEEREEIAFFRMQERETNIYYRALQDALDMVDVVVYDITKHLKFLSSHTPSGTLIIKDIVLLEEAMRRTLSVRISIEKLVTSLREFKGTEYLIEFIRWIEAMYIEFPVRPTGPEVSPPGGYGETYFLPQSEIWHRGCVNLSLVNSSLLMALTSWRETRTIETRRQHSLISSIEEAIAGLLNFHHKKKHTGVIIEIQENCLTLSLIPRDLQREISVLLSGYEQVYLYGIGLGGDKIQEFLKNEIGITITTSQTTAPEKGHIKVNPYIQKELKKSSNLGGAVILTTSARHVREIGKSLDGTGLKILMQGISGGKGKQLGLFMENPENTVLIGTIDMWREELELWKHARHIIIAKLPFDPPTDAYFLARTVGMKNNFTLYSEPMLIIKINTLLSRIYSSTYRGTVYCEDSRLTDTIWGKELTHEIV